MSKRKDKKKKSLVKRIFKWTGILVLLLIIAIILVPILFKDKIKELAVTEANKALLADVALGDFDLTFLSSFPKLTVSFNDVSVTGRDKFEGVKLLDVKQFEASVGLWSVLGGDQIKVKSIKLIEPNIDVRVLQDGSANYNIVATDSNAVEEQEEVKTEEPSSFKLQLEEYAIVDGNIRYDDDAGEIFAEIKDLDHTGKGNLSDDVINFVTSTQTEELTFGMNGLNYANKLNTDLAINLLMEFKENSSKFTLAENTIRLNAFKISLDGFYEMLEGKDNIDLKLNTEKASFKELISLIPAFYTAGYENMTSGGTLTLGAFVKGILDENNFPAWDFNLKVADANVRYPDVPGSIDNINIVALSKFEGGGNLDKMTVDIDKFHADFVGNELDATMHMKNVITDPYVQTMVKADVDLSTLEKVIPMSDGESYNGKLLSDIEIAGNLSALDREDYEAFDAHGKLQLDDMAYNSKDLPSEVDIETMTFLFSNKNLNLENFKAKMGSSDFEADGTIDNYMGYAFRDEPLHGSFNYYSKNLNLDELMPASEENTTANTESSSEQATVSEEPLLIPGNINFDLNSKIDNLVYDGMEIKNVAGEIDLKDEKAILSDLTLDALGGNIKMNGEYNTQNHLKPNANFGYDLKQVDINQLTSNFVTVGKFAPIAKYAQGLIDSKFTVNTDVLPDFTPDYNTLDGAGDLFANTLQIAGFKPLDKLAEVMRISDISNGEFKDIKAFFEMTEGKLKMKPFTVNFGKGLTSEVSGTTALNEEIDYKMQFNVPKKYIPGDIVKVAEQAIAKVNKIPGFKMDGVPDNLPVTTLLTNTITNPKIKTNFKEALMEKSGNVKDVVTDLIDNVVDKAKDSAMSIVNDAVEDVKEDVEAKKKEILNEAQTQVDKINAEAKRAADKVRAEAKKQADDLVKSAGMNPLKKKAAEIAGKRIIATGEKNALKIENEAKKRGEGIMTKAQEKADKIG